MKTRLGRLLSMGPVELWERGSQAAHARAEAWGTRGRVGYLDAERFLALLLPALVPRERGEALAEGWRTSPFWFEHAERAERAALLGERVPEVAAGVIRAADAAVGGEVELFPTRFAGTRIAARVSDPCDWHRCPMTGRVWPRLSWREIDYLPGNPLGDVKFVWELSRHGHFLALGQAAALTGEPCYGQALSAQMASWLAQNPPGIGVHWCSSLEVAIRSLAWLWATRLAMDCPGFGREAGIDAARLLWYSGRRLSRFLSTYSSPNTHLLGEALALWTLGVTVPWLPEADRWRRRGWSRLCTALCAQLRPDGGHVEQSTSYHRYALELGLLALTLAERAGEAVPDTVRDRVAAAARFARDLTGPDGLLPPLGDCDGGATLPLVSRDPHDARGWIAVAAGLGMAAGAGVSDTPESLWVVGRATGADHRPPTTDHRRPTTVVFPETGLAVMRATDGCLVFDAGPHGFGRAGHGHADALSVELSLGEERVLVDPGTFHYGARVPWRDAFRCAAAHNTILIDGVEPATPEGPFAWASRVDGRLDRRPTTGDRRPTTGDRRPTIGDPPSAIGIDWVEGLHDGYRGLDDPVRLKRRVVFCRGEYWVIEDYALGCKEHEAHLFFHLAAGATVELDPSGGVRVLTVGGRVLWLIPLEEGVAVEVVTGRSEPPMGWVSPRYGERVAAPVVRFRHRRVAPFRCRTLLLPAASGVSADELRAMVDGIREAWGA